MSDITLQGLALAACCAGMAALALSVSAHWRQVFGARARPEALRLALTGSGAALLALAFWLCAAADPPTMAILVWTMLLTIAAVLVAAALTLHARLTRPAPTVGARGPLFMRLD